MRYKMRCNLKFEMICKMRCKMRCNMRCNMRCKVRCKMRCNMRRAPIVAKGHQPTTRVHIPQKSYKTSPEVLERRVCNALKFYSYKIAYDDRSQVTD